MLGKEPNTYQIRIAFFAMMLTLVVLSLGAYTRLSDAGLGCPDWPLCYGKLIVPEISTLPHYPIIDNKKAWIEMTHRYVAGLLGLVILSLALLAIYNRKDTNQPLFLPILLVLLVIFQALLGMWTVTLKLLPIIVMAHLLGGMTTLAGLCWLTLRLQRSALMLIKNTKKHPFYSLQLKWLSIIGLFILILQVALGAWTSANYAALVCPDFPFCQGTSLNTMPTFYLSEAFSLFNPSLSLEARMTIHVMHRIGAIITTGVIGWLVVLLFKANEKRLGLWIGILLILQIILGITNVLGLLPLPIALSHHAVAALLLLLLVTLTQKIYYSS